MHTTLESLQEPEKLTRGKRILSAVGGVVCAAAGVAVLKYLPYDAHDSMAFQPMLASGLMLAGGILELQAMRGEVLTPPEAEDSEQR